jgi:hypothetical protein
MLRQVGARLFVAELGLSPFSVRMNRPQIMDRVRLLTIATFFVLLVILGGWALLWYELFYDEGVRLGKQIASEATALRASTETERVFTFRPLLGTHQHYWIGIGAGPQCLPPCDSQSAVTVQVEHGHGGSTAYYKSFVGVPLALQVEKNGDPVRVTLRKRGPEIEVVALR